MYKKHFLSNGIVIHLFVLFCLFLLQAFLVFREIVNFSNSIYFRQHK